MTGHETGTREAWRAARLGLLDAEKELTRRGEPTTLVDARAERSYNEDDIQARGSVRVHPDDPVRSALEQRLSQQATLVVYCA